MHHLIVTACRVHPERMKEFFGHIQQWEHELERAPHRPEYHSLYVNEADPSRVLLLTRFDSARHAEEFEATGLLDGFTERILSCSAGEVDQVAYDLYYAVGPGGPRVVFGEEAGAAF
jgi:hypothetical protein